MKEKDASITGITDRVEILSTAKLPTKMGTFEIITFRLLSDSTVHVALCKGSDRYSACETVLVRIHSECLTGEAFNSLKCDCGDQLQESLKRISANNSGLMIYLRGHEGRGIGLAEKIKAYALQEEGIDTEESNIILGHEIDSRSYAAAVAFIKKLNINNVTLMTGNPKKIEALKEAGIHLEKVIYPSIKPNSHNEKYLKTKVNKFGHQIDIKEITND